MRQIYRALKISGLMMVALLSTTLSSKNAYAQVVNGSDGAAHQGVMSQTFMPSHERFFQGRMRLLEPVPLPEAAVVGNLPMKNSLLSIEGNSNKNLHSIFTDGIPSGCNQAFIAGVGYDEPLMENGWLNPSAPKMGAALDVTVPTSNNCPVVTGFERRDDFSVFVRAFRWEWDINYTKYTDRISPSLYSDLPGHVSNQFPNNSPVPDPSNNYFSYIDLPIHLSFDGRTIVGSAQYALPSGQQKQGFRWDKTPAGAQTLYLSPDLEPNSSSIECSRSSVAYGAAEIDNHFTIVGQGTGNPTASASFDGVVCRDDKGKTVVTNGPSSNMQISHSSSNYSYASAISPDGTRYLRNDLVNGSSKKSHYINAATHTGVQLKYLPNTLIDTNRFSQAEAFYMQDGNPASALIFGHSNIGTSGSAQDRASSAVMWNASGDVVRTVGTAVPGLRPGCVPNITLEPPITCLYSECNEEGCPFTEARDGTSQQTIVGVNYFPPRASENDVCALTGMAGYNWPRIAFINTPAGGTQKLADYASQHITYGTPAYADLAKWKFCQAEGVFENNSVMTVVGIGVYSPNGDFSNPANRSIRGFVLHMPKGPGGAGGQNYLQALEPVSKLSPVDRDN